MEIEGSGGSEKHDDTVQAGAQAPAARQQKRGSGGKAIVAVAVLVVLLIAIVVVSLSVGLLHTPSSTAHSQHAVVNATAAYLYNNVGLKHLSLSELKQVEYARLANITDINVSYSGASVEAVKIYSLSTNLVILTSYNYAKYGNDTKETYIENLSESRGNTTVMSYNAADAFARINGTDYYCALGSTFKLGSNVSESAARGCVINATLGNMATNASGDMPAMLSGLFNAGISYRNVSNSTYGGYRCLRIIGNATLKTNSTDNGTAVQGLDALKRAFSALGVGEINGTFDECISYRYYMPLESTLSLAGGDANASVVINTTDKVSSIGNTTRGYVDALPEPLVASLANATTSAPATSTTTTAPAFIVFNDIYNGEFSTGTYLGWNVSGEGFGSAPLNITNATERLCYLGAPWRGYNGSFFATTFTCGTSVAIGNLTSSYFYANMPYLNFKIISPQDEGLYVEVLHDGVPQIKVFYNTYNASYGATGSYTFRNASIPLYSVRNEVVRVRVVADTLRRQSFIAVGDFAMSHTPLQTSGIVANLTYG